MIPLMKLDYYVRSLCQGRVFFNLLVLFLRYHHGRYVIVGMCYVYTCEFAGFNGAIFSLSFFFFFAISSYKS
jgi:hypothetical protein